MLAGLFSAALADPALARARDLAGCRAAEHGRHHRPGRAAPVRGRGRRRRGGGGRPVLAVTATSREADDLAAALRGLIPADAGRGLPGLGDAAARAALAALRHGRAPARRAAPARPPGDATSRRAAARGRRAGPLRAAAAAQGARRPRAGASCAAGDEADLDDGRPPAGRHRLRPGRPGHQARRVRRPRRHPRRLPADRGAPAAGRVLGRRGRGDPLLRGRRPAHPRRRSTGCGRRRAGSCCSPTRSATGPRELAAAHPELAEMLGQARRGHPGRGHGVAGPGAARRRRLAWSCCSTACRPAPYVLLCDPERIRTRAHDLVRTSEEFLQAQLGRGGRRRQGADRPRARPPSSTLAEVRAARRPRCGQPWWTIAPFGLAEAATGRPRTSRGEGEPTGADVSPDAGDR